MRTPFPFATLVFVLTSGMGMGAIQAATSTSSEGSFDQVVGPFFKEHCDRCHNEKTQKGDFRIDTMSKDFTNGTALSHWRDVLDRISSAEMPPEDEKQPAADEAAKIVEWLAARLKEGESTMLSKREKVSFLRLTREEYANTIQDLLGVRFDAMDPTGLSEDQEWRGFERIGTVLSLSPAHVEKYFSAAESILAEALPVKAPEKFVRRKDAIDLRGGPDRAEMVAQGIADKVRVDLWPGADLGGGRVGPGQALPAAGDYRVRIQLSGLKPKNGRAPHLAFYSIDLDRMLFEQDIIAPEDKPVVVEFTAHLPAGPGQYRMSNDVPGPPTTPRSGRADPSLPFISIKEGRRPWQMKLTDEEGLPIVPFLIVDWVEWEGPLTPEGPTYAQQHFIPKESGNMVQARDALARFTEKAFRRPVKDAEVDAYVKLVESEMRSGEKFEDAMKTALLAVLCSKDFYYLVEGSAETGTTKLNDWELASRLSYFLWSTMPDEALLESARKGVLHQPEVLRGHVTRMLHHAKAERFAEAFPKQWLQLRMVGMFTPDKKLYPDYDRYLEKSMIKETTAYFREVLAKNLGLGEFLNSDWTMLNARLAEHYQLAGVTGSDFQRVALRPEDNRGGLLTQAAVLSLTSDGTRHRPVHRGKWILESIIGRPPPPPPANVKPIESTPLTEPKATLRMKLAAHQADASCASCHKKIDPLGLAFDNYDAIGRWRTEEAVSDCAGNNPKVDASGVLIDGRKFTNATELKKLLLDDMDKFNHAFVEKLATYAARRTLTLSDRDALTALAKQSKAADYKLQSIIEALVLSDLFQQR